MSETLTAIVRGGEAVRLSTGVSLLGGKTMVGESDIRSALTAPDHWANAEPAPPRHFTTLPTNPPPSTGPTFPFWPANEPQPPTSSQWGLGQKMVAPRKLLQSLVRAADCLEAQEAVK